MPVWKRNVIICWIGSFTTTCGLSLVVPFIAFYIEQLGVKDIKSIEELSGVAFAVTYLIAAIMSPVWGKLADKRGRKVVLLITSFGLATVSFLTGFSANIYMLIGFRALQGLVSGYNPAAISLVAKETPEKNVGWALATLSTGSMAGSLLGPVIGGYLDEILGIRNVFFVTSIFLLLSFLIAKIFIVEKSDNTLLKKVKDEEEKNYSEESIWSKVEAKYFVFGLLISSCIINAANQSIEPIVSLYVKQLLTNTNISSSHTSFYSGIVMSATGLGILLTASKIGKFGDRKGYIRVLIYSIICSAVIFVPMAFVRNPWELMGLRFILGIAQAGIIPAIATLLKKNTCTEISGRIFGFNQAAQYSGLVIGPLLGGQISSHFGFVPIFFSTSLLLMVNLMIIIIISRVSNAKLT